MECNLNNITEICFEKTISSNQNINSTKLNDTERTSLDNCIDKYLLAFNIVKQETNDHIEKFFTDKKEY